jgi:hypothetical protein
MAKEAGADMAKEADADMAKRSRGFLGIADRSHD